MSTGSLISDQIKVSVVTKSDHFVTDELLLPTEDACGSSSSLSSLPLLISHGRHRAVCLTTIQAFIEGRLYQGPFPPKFASKNVDRNLATIDPLPSPGESALLLWTHV